MDPAARIGTEGIAGCGIGQAMQPAPAVLGKVTPLALGAYPLTIPQATEDFTLIVEFGQGCLA